MVEKKEVQDEQQNGANENEQPQSPGGEVPSPTGETPAGTEPMDTQDVSQKSAVLNVRSKSISV